MTPEERSQAAFEIGWDFARYGIQPIAGTAPPEICKAYEAGKEHFGRRTIFHDRFVRKWLLLRTNAWVRGRAVDKSVTAETLRRIDVPFCPVTRVRLTHGALEGTDWSIDRLYNNAAYTLFNLVVMSTKANKAKGDRSHAEILATQWHAEATGERPFGLGADEWARMWRLALYAESIVEAAPEWRPSHGVRPMLVMPPPGIPVADPDFVIELSLFNEGLRWLHDGPKAVRARSDQLARGKKTRHALWALTEAVAMYFTRQIKTANKVYDFGDDEPGKMTLIRTAYEDMWAEHGDALLPLLTKFVVVLAKENTFSDFFERLKSNGLLKKDTMRQDAILDSMRLDTNGYA